VYIIYYSECPTCCLKLFCCLVEWQLFPVFLTKAVPHLCFEMHLLLQACTAISLPWHGPSRRESTLLRAWRAFCTRCAAHGLHWAAAGVVTITRVAPEVTLVTWQQDRACLT
jgi:hypothetical protein